MRYLSVEWLEEAARVFEASDPLPRDVEMVLQQSVLNTPEGDIDYAIVLSGQSLKLEVGRSNKPTISFTQEWTTAIAIASGELSAQAAFMEGKVKLGGDTSVLVANHDLLADVEDLLSDLRSRTDFPDA
ncbi:MAG: SCP2 sterol-binding domain-containing protein [Acidimicrobiales bacterium]